MRREQLWGGALWSSGYYANTVGMYASRDVIEQYIKNHGRERYEKLYEGQLELDLCQM